MLIPFEQKIIKNALNYPGWHVAMVDEMWALIKMRLGFSEIEYYLREGLQMRHHDVSQQ